MNLADFPDEVVEALAWPFEFDIRQQPSRELWPKLFPPSAFMPLAREGAGGGYAQLPTGGILFVDSEGAGGLIAANLPSLMLLFVCHPYWRDLLKFSGGGSLAEMRRVLPLAAADFYEDVPEARELGRMIRQCLNLGHATDVVDQLHASVVSSPASVELVGGDGTPLNSLFNQFTAGNNPMWKNRLQPFA